MRYKVRVPLLENFRRAEKIARADTHVFVALEGRGVLSTGDLSEPAKLALTGLGATIAPDSQYHLVG